MILRNCLGFDTRHGYRTLELFDGDLTSDEGRADMLVVSAIANSYLPVPSTVLGALHQRWGIDLRSLDRELDLTACLGFWISGQLERGNYKRLIAIEMRGGSVSIPEALDNVFTAIALADARGFACRSIAMPLLGTGLQEISAAVAMNSLVPAVRRALEQIYSLERVSVIEKNPERASALALSLNDLLGRRSVSLPKDQLLSNLRNDLCAFIDQHKLVALGEVFVELRRMLTQQEARSFEVGMLSRKLVEFVVNDVLGAPAQGEPLATRINRLRSAGVVSWITSYMHTMRHFGNEAAHEQSAVPAARPFLQVTEEDLAICLFCMHRIVHFWTGWRGPAGTSEGRQ